MAGRKLYWRHWQVKKACPVLNLPRHGASRMKRTVLSVRLKGRHRHGSAHMFLTRVSSVCLGARKHRREARTCSSSPHQEYRRSSFARAPSRSQFGDSSLRKLRREMVHQRTAPVHGSRLSTAARLPPTVTGSKSFRGYGRLIKPIPAS